MPKGFAVRSASARKDLASALRDHTRSLTRPTAVQTRRSTEDEEAIEQLRLRLRQHPCHGCNDREEHARWAERYWRLRDHVDQEQDRIAERTHTVARQFDRVCEVLLTLGYLEGEGDRMRVTEAGRTLSGLYTEKDLLVAECVRGSVWSELPPAGLAAVCSGMLFESRQTDEAPRLPPGATRRAIDETTRVWADLHRLEREHRLHYIREPDWGLSDAVFRWANGARLGQVLTDSDLSAGDFVRWTKQVIDLLGQIADAAPDPLATTARDAAGLIDRGVIRYSTVP